MCAQYPRWIGVLAISSLLLFSSALAADPPGPAPAYQVDVEASRVYVKVGSATFIGHEHGVEARLKSGTIALGGKGELHFDMASFTADTPEARKRVGLKAGKISASDAKKITQTMRGPEVLDVAKFPAATFQITALKPMEGTPGMPGRYQIEGDFTLHGSRRSLQLTATLARAPQPQHMQLTRTFKIEQKDYGIKPYSTAGGLIRVSNELEITAELLLIPTVE